MDQRQGINNAESAKNKEPQGTMATEALTANRLVGVQLGTTRLTRAAGVMTSERLKEERTILRQHETAAHEGALDNWDEDRTSQSSLPISRGEKGSVLSKLSKTDRNTMRALIKIPTLTGGDEAVAQQIETIISEQAKLKNLLMDQAQQIAFQKGRMEQLEKRRQDALDEQRKKATQSNSPANESQPTYALVVSSGTLEKKEVASLLRQRVDPLDLGIQDATIRPGREATFGHIRTSKEDSAKILQFIENDKEMKNVPS
ncbi:hypothetical protein MTO96_032161 [Rhipicephalus appendiculatus]